MVSVRGILLPPPLPGDSTILSAAVLTAVETTGCTTVAFMKASVSPGFYTCADMVGTCSDGIEVAGETHLGKGEANLPSVACDVENPVLKPSRTCPAWPLLSSFSTCRAGKVCGAAPFKSDRNSSRGGRTDYRRSIEDGTKHVKERTAGRLEL